MTIFDEENPWSETPAGAPETSDLQNATGDCRVWMLTDERRTAWNVPAYDGCVAAVVEWFDSGAQVYASLVDRDELEALRANFAVDAPGS